MNNHQHGTKGLIEVGTGPDLVKEGGWYQGGMEGKVFSQLCSCGDPGSVYLLSHLAVERPTSFLHPPFCSGYGSAGWVVCPMGTGCSSPKLSDHNLNLLVIAEGVCRDTPGFFAFVSKV